VGEGKNNHPPNQRKKKDPRPRTPRKASCISTCLNWLSREKEKPRDLGRSVPSPSLILLSAREGERRRSTTPRTKKNGWYRRLHLLRHDPKKKKGKRGSRSPENACRGKKDILTEMRFSLLSASSTCERKGGKKRGSPRADAAGQTLKKKGREDSGGEALAVTSITFAPSRRP